MARHQRVGQHLHATALHSAYPERALPRIGWLDRLGARAFGPVARRLKVRQGHPASLLPLIAEHSRRISPLTASAFQEAARDLRMRLRREGLQEALVAEAFAMVREAAGRTIGQRHYDVQMVGGWILLNGLVAEMETGEGKTLTATLPACAAAMAGIPVHVITVNDYLTARDAKWMGPVYRELGLTVGVITHDKDPQARREAYACDVTYCTNKELAFDYLRDRMAVGRNPHRIQLQLERLYGGDARANKLVLRGLHFGIVDEADSVLVDEARTPLIISGSGGQPPEQKIFDTALRFAGDLAAGTDFEVDLKDRIVRLLPLGQAKLQERAGALGGIWSGRRRREELVRQALTALHLFFPDQHYLVQNQKVRIVDEFTGRIMGDRSWEQGLHQMIELKEGVPLTPVQSTLARMTYQRFFRRYVRLAGMTGTAKEIAGELWWVYRLAVVRVPTNRPVQRRNLGVHVFTSAEGKWEAVVARIQELNRMGQPILVGTRSVAASEQLSRRLTVAGLAHRVLNARQDAEEADIVARAGEVGRITVATNMAGRGTDILLGPGIRELGGLHVIATERHEAGRIDRQLFGRCGRQGDPGSYETFVSLEDELVRVTGPRLWRSVAWWLSSSHRPIVAHVGAWVVERAQRAAERLHARVRRDLLKSEEQLESALAFSGRLE
jgi:preprotein translocase subunit SecA